MDVHQNQDLVENPSNNGNNNSHIDSSSLNSPPPTSNENLHHHVHDDDQQPTIKYCEQVSRYLPGFRYNLKDEELVDFYLKKKVANEQLPSNIVIDVELIYKRPPSKNERKVEENEALIASSSQNHNSHNNNPNPHYPELQRINIHQNPSFMEHQHPPIPPLFPATYFQQHDPDSTNPNPDLTMDNDVSGGLEPLSPSPYLSTGITYEDIWNQFLHEDA
ncbi:hypothetical protein FEM48_Zijuj05G0128700 [Ziziphus jujuba var. spinosa]|uniref:NAC domain-containing protein n=1 Tax=Ziziphus jujuba var. spinosa TaxID=714518 RepID=A0A978VEX9_ZIZJJ|nr:hypothetical protein FEM48_Zijuj05G0128700 [Ziziphus jujuba var. spinosa]